MYILFKRTRKKNFRVNLAPGQSDFVLYNRPDSEFQMIAQLFMFYKYSGIKIVQLVWASFAALKSFFSP